MAALVPGSTAPKQRRCRQWPQAVVSEIRRLRNAHPNLSKEKLHPFLDSFAATHRLPCPSPRTIGRLIADAASADSQQKSSPARKGFLVIGRRFYCELLHHGQNCYTCL